MNGSRRRLFWLIPLATFAVTLFVLAWQHREYQRLASELDDLTAAPVRLATPRPTAGNAPPAVVAPSSAADDLAAAERLRTEVDALKTQIARREQALRQSLAARPDPTRPPPSILEESLPHTDWQNAGQETPAGAVETALWAGAGGDVDALAQTLKFDSEAAAAAAELFARLPPDLRAEYREPARLVALLATADVPLTAARLTAFDLNDENHQIVVAQIEVPEQKRPRIVKLDTTRDPIDRRWKITVPKSAITRYAERLTGDPQPEAAAPAPQPN